MAINVVDCGAVGDGIDKITGRTDLTHITAFRAAHDALPANGGTIIIPAGKYRLKETWTITKPFVLMGESPPNPHRNGTGIIMPTVR